jgi:hypothetical protein
MFEILFSDKRNQKEIQKIYDALKEICNQNLKRLRKSDDIGSFGDMVTGRNLAKNREFAYIF